MDASEQTIFIVSDGRGGTANALVRAALVQFPGQSFQLVVRSDVRTPDEVKHIVDEAARRRAVIFYTLVQGETRVAMEKGHCEAAVPVIDLLGPTLSGLHDLFLERPGEMPGLLYERERERIDRVEAVNFAMTHDDGQRIDELSNADVVLVGVSRSHKSSTCVFLAMGGVKAANVPLFADRSVPPELTALDPSRVIGLTIRPSHLLAIRRHRAADLGFDSTNPYLSEEEVKFEQRVTNSVIVERGWRTILVSYRAIEEIAKEIMRLIGHKPETYGHWY